jgi:hypothetical protein
MQTATTPQLTPKEAHQVKMGVKRNLRAHSYRKHHNPNEYVPANLSRNHPDYGMSMKDHEAEKAARNTQKSS